MSFKETIGVAVKDMVTTNNLVGTHTDALYTPMRENGFWEWKRFSTTDGLLIKEVSVPRGNTAECAAYGKVYSCVIVQSEERTAEDLLNVWGKASIIHLPGGIWVDIHGPVREGHTIPDRNRVQLTFIRVLFLTPQLSGNTDYEKRLRNLARVGLASNDVKYIALNPDLTGTAMAQQVWPQVAAMLEP